MTKDISLIDLIAYAAKHAPNEVLGILANQNMQETARSNDNRPAYFRMSVEDGWVVNFNGTRKRDLYYLLRIPADLIEKAADAQPVESGKDPEVIISGP